MLSLVFFPLLDFLHLSYELLAPVFLILGLLLVSFLSGAFFSIIVVPLSIGLLPPVLASLRHTAPVLHHDFIHVSQVKDGVGPGVVEHVVVRVGLLAPLPLSRYLGLVQASVFYHVEAFLVVLLDVLFVDIVLREAVEGVVEVVLFLAVEMALVGAFSIVVVGVLREDLRLLGSGEGLELGGAADYAPVGWVQVEGCGEWESGGAAKLGVSLELIQHIKSFHLKFKFIRFNFRILSSLRFTNLLTLHTHKITE